MGLIGNTISITILSRWGQVVKKQKSKQITNNIIINLSLFSKTISKVSSSWAKCLKLESNEAMKKKKSQMQPLKHKICLHIDHGHEIHFGPIGKELVKYL